MTVDINQVVVIKLNINHEEVWRYSGHILEQDEHSILIEARFNRDDLTIHGLTYKRNDRFVERYYDNRWYNIYAVHDRDDDRLKGWYCNITRPAEIEPGKITYVDLALDVLAFPDGHYLVLDEDEFAELLIDDQTRAKAREGLKELEVLVQSGGLMKAAN